MQLVYSTIPADWAARNVGTVGTVKTNIQAMFTFEFLHWIHPYWPTSKDLCISDLCGHQMSTSWAMYNAICKILCPIELVCLIAHGCMTGTKYYLPFRRLNISHLNFCDMGQSFSHLDLWKWGHDQEFGILGIRADKVFYKSCSTLTESLGKYMYAFTLSTWARSNHHSQGRPEGSLFNSYYTEVLGRVLLLSLDCST